MEKDANTKNEPSVDLSRASFFIFVQKLFFSELKLHNFLEIRVVCKIRKMLYYL